MKKPEAEKIRLTRERKFTIINVILLLVILIVIVQLWLLTATMNAFLGGDDGAVLPAALVSLGCLLLNLGLLRYVYRLE